VQAGFVVGEITEPEGDRDQVERFRGERQRQRIRLKQRRLQAPSPDLPSGLHQHGMTKIAAEHWPGSAFLHRKQHIPCAATEIQNPRARLL